VVERQMRRKSLALDGVLLKVSFPTPYQRALSLSPIRLHLSDNLKSFRAAVRGARTRIFWSGSKFII